MPRSNFDPANTELLKGINLIEASAGTGKTYTIAMLALRFVVEQGVSIDRMLIVTFTKAATEELKQRVRARLLQAKAALDGEMIDDSSLLAWLGALDIDPEEIKRRLQLALLDIDQAGIFTIHGFCQRVLSEHALESGQLFDTELTGDIAVIKQAVADDVWRKQLYCRSAFEVSVLTCVYKTPDALAGSVAGISDHLTVFPDMADIDPQLALFKQQLHDLQPLAVKNGEIIASVLADGFFKSAYVSAFDVRQQTLLNWLQGKTEQLPDNEALTLYCSDSLLDALNGQKFRKTKEKTGEQRKLEYLETLKLSCTEFDRVSDGLQQITLIFRRQLLEVMRQEVGKRLQQQNQLSFDDLISRLAAALQGDKGELLTQTLQQRFQVALIDEFQDTDQNQWFIFDSLFAGTEHYLYLIGDPKQAIYKFRGADIYSYFAAQQTAQQQYTLGFNWRSHPHLVDAVNVLFARDNTFFQQQPVFESVKPGLTLEQGQLTLNQQAVAPLALWQLPESETKDGYWTSGVAAGRIQAHIVDEILTLLHSYSGFSLQLPSGAVAVSPKDIAILVRTNDQAREYQAALRKVGVPSVLNSAESVFASQEARDLYRVLYAVVHPADLNAVKQAMILNWFALDGPQFYRLIHDEQALEQCLSRFQDYHLLWQAKGLMAMMQNLLAQEQVKVHLARTDNAERQLTNLHHLIELVQQAIVDEHLAMNKALDWLQTAIHQAEQGRMAVDEQQLRLESDEQAVKIVTMHRSKGLEYNIVFCPYLWHRSARLNTETELIQCHEQGQMIADLGSKAFERRRQQARDEELAEDLRVFYVAVTRAKFRCYLAWADVRSKDKANDSAMSWLLELGGLDFAQQQARLNSYAEQNNRAIEYRLLTQAYVEIEPYRAEQQVVEFQLLTRRRSLHSLWQMSSYTALSALSQHDAPELPEDKADEKLQDIAILSPEDDLPKGAQTGNVVHELLELNDFAELFDGKDISSQRHALCQRYGLILDNPELLDRLLKNVVNTPLTEDKEFCLKNLTSAQCLKEMPFYLYMPMMNTLAVNKILADSDTFQPLSSKQMQGYLTGFIDLVCEYHGKYYVIDYKTNSLTDYTEKSLITAMRAHNYGLQYWIYTVVLHQYLQQRLPNYDYQQHFGGVCYLFVRGMQADKKLSGIYQTRPEFDKVSALSAIFAR